MVRRGHLAGFAINGAIHFGRSGEITAQQHFIDNEAYRAARRGSLIVDRFASKRRFEGWGAWAQDRIRVRGSRLSVTSDLFTYIVSKFLAVALR